MLRANLDAAHDREPSNGIAPPRTRDVCDCPVHFERDQLRFVVPTYWNVTSVMSSTGANHAKVATRSATVEALELADVLFSDHHLTSSLRGYQLR